MRRDFPEAPPHIRREFPDPPRREFPDTPRRDFPEGPTAPRRDFPDGSSSRQAPPAPYLAGMVAGKERSFAGSGVLLPHAYPYEDDVRHQHWPGPPHAKKKRRMEDEGRPDLAPPPVQVSARTGATQQFAAM